MRTRNQTLIGLFTFAVLLFFVIRAFEPFASAANEAFRVFVPQVATDEPRSATPSPSATLPPGTTATATATGGAAATGTATPTPGGTATATASPTTPATPTPVPPTPTPTPEPGMAFSVAFLDVGQGDAILVTVNGERMLIDGGRSSTLALSRLQALGVTDLDAILMTHPDADHIGGLAAVLNAFSVERIYLNGGTADTQVFATFMAAVNAEGADVITPVRGGSIPLGGLSLPVLHPAVTSAAQDNNTSLVVRLTCGNVRVLFTGDAETAAESSMLAAGVVSDVDVLKVSHHGSATASSLAFLQAARPEVAVISAGRTNSYGHPSPDVVARLNSIGASILSTDTTEGNDTVVMTSDCDSYSFGGVSAATLFHSAASPAGSVGTVLQGPGALAGARIRPERWAAMRVLVTGGTGFVGSHTVKALQDAGHEVRLLVRDAARIGPALEPLGAGAVQYTPGDITDREAVARAMEGCGAVIHAASVYSNDPRRAKEIAATNMAGAQAVLGLAVERGLDPVVHVSSYVALVEEGREVVNEETPPGRSPWPYPASKAEQEAYARGLQDAGAPVVITNPGGVWGPHDPHEGESVQMARRFARGLTPLMPRGTIPVVHVAEVAKAHAAIMEPGRGPRRYLLGGPSISGWDMAKTVQAAAGVRRPMTPIPAGVGYAAGRMAGAVQGVLPFRLPIEPATTWLLRCATRTDNSRAEQELGIVFRPAEETIREQVAWQKAAGRL